MTLPIGHVVLASAAMRWTPPKDVEYVMCSALYDPQEKTMRLVLEGVNAVGDEVRSVFYWDDRCSEWVSGDYKRKHALLLPIDEEDES